MRLPITINILYSNRAPSYSNTMLWAMCCLAFFGFLWVSEFTIPSEGFYDPTTHLSLQDVLIDRRDNSLLLQVSIKQSKTDRFRRYKAIHRSKRQHSLSYQGNALVSSCSGESKAGPLFITKQGRGLTRQMFSSALNTLLTQLKLKLDCRNYNTHSYRIGVATSAAQAMIPDNFFINLASSSREVLMWHW